ncbi:MAG TPA: ATP-binding protein [Candidatus Diapherotrites archaeon]|uniref:ATP-binding protein n=1 Tax=Candidatus Iainarchaeum sp. TaxID=3101447 RepID=A0A7J4IXG8_9ARCH|nr:ATP-binding protein [Candidatus Diapherotrites archaeon]
MVKTVPETAVDVDAIKEISARASTGIEKYRKRFFAEKIHAGKEPRITVIRGFRGLGKTTALLGLLDKDSIYFSMDHARIVAYSLYDVGKALIESGYITLLIDEVHKYPDWERDIKSLYDEFKEASFIVSGSAPLAFNPDRRFKIIEANQLSLREFMHLAGRQIGFSEKWRTYDGALEFIKNNPGIEKEFSQYMAGGASPTYFKSGEDTLDGVYNSIMKSIREDAVLFAKIDAQYILGMEKAVTMLSNAKLGEFSINTFCNALELKKHKTYELIDLLGKMKVLRLVQPHSESFAGARKEPKLMFYHPVYRQAIAKKTGVKPDIGAIREELAAFALCERGYSVHTIKGEKKSPDYLAIKGREKILIEVGGENKTKTQLKMPIKASEKIILKEKQLIPLLNY